MSYLRYCVALGWLLLGLILTFIFAAGGHGSYIAADVIFGPAAFVSYAASSGEYIILLPVFVAYPVLIAWLYGIWLFRERCWLPVFLHVLGVAISIATTFENRFYSQWYGIIECLSSVFLVVIVFGVFVLIGHRTKVNKFAEHISE